MANQAPQAFMDTVQIAHDEDATASGEADFAATVQIEGQVWPEAPDFQGSESASLFAGTQPANLGVV
jgi:hypothetical protein